MPQGSPRPCRNASSAPAPPVRLLPENPAHDKSRYGRQSGRQGCRYESLSVRQGCRTLPVHGRVPCPRRWLKRRSPGSLPLPARAPQTRGQTPHTDSGFTSAHGSAPTGRCGRKNTLTQSACRLAGDSRSSTPLCPHAQPGIAITVILNAVLTPLSARATWNPPNPVHARATGEAVMKAARRLRSAAVPVTAPARKRSLFSCAPQRLGVA